MKLLESKSESDWEFASATLLAVVDWLNAKKTSLWSKDQVSIETLRNDYRLSQLFWLNHNSQNVGLVFLMDSDPFFWPDSDSERSLYFHKLAIHPKYAGRGFGRIALGEIKKHAISHGFEWVRLDCDDREPLHKFYSKSGYQLVDIKPMQKYMVARYQLLTNQSNSQLSAARTARSAAPN